MTKNEIVELYGLTDYQIQKYLPAPHTIRGKRGTKYVWHPDEVYAAFENEELLESMRLEAIKRDSAAQKKRKAERDAITNILNEYNIDTFTENAKKLQRRFYLHVGPTNSGKTYDAVMALKKARNGVYLGPLRLLALEMFDKLNADGCLCNLLTGEESIVVPDATYTASTIEMCNFERQYDVAIIDEAQMIADKDRGHSWTKAIFMVKAYEIHLCFAPEALDIIKETLDNFGAEYSVIEHKRFTPLEFAGEMKQLSDVQQGDAIIRFSRKGVLATAAELEKNGIKASVIYGALPPAARREEVGKFTEGITSVVVATDAIGMGISLPIKRIIFGETMKFDGEELRDLEKEEIIQIAGRAGRYGMFDKGEVLTMGSKLLIQKALEKGADPVKEITIPFPDSAVSSKYPIDKLFDVWSEMPAPEGFKRQDMTEPGELYHFAKTKKLHKKFSKEMLYNLITCPVDVNVQPLVDYWYNCCIDIYNNTELSLPDFYTGSLEGCELYYRGLDIRHQLMRRVGQEDTKYIKERKRIIKTINSFLDDKKIYTKKCRMCGTDLPSNTRYNLCDKCYRNRRY